MTLKKKQPKIKVKKAIPNVPFTLEEVYLLSQYEGSEALQNRLRVWKASNDYAFIKSLNDLMIRDYANHNRKLSKQERELKNQYINWLAVGLESDKFNSLDNIRLRNVNLVRNDEDYHNHNHNHNYNHNNKDTLTHSGIL